MVVHTKREIRILTRLRDILLEAKNSDKSTTCPLSFEKQLTKDGSVVKILHGDAPVIGIRLISDDDNGRTLYMERHYDEKGVAHEARTASYVGGAIANLMYAIDRGGITQAIENLENVIIVRTPAHSFQKKNLFRDKNGNYPKKERRRLGHWERQANPVARSFLIIESMIGSAPLFSVKRSSKDLANRVYNEQTALELASQEELAFLKDTVHSKMLEKLYFQREHNITTRRQWAYTLCTAIADGWKDNYRIPVVKEGLKQVGMILRQRQRVGNNLGTPYRSLILPFFNAMRYDMETKLHKRR